MFQSTGWILLWTLAQSNAHQQAQKTIAGKDVTYEHLRIPVSKLREFRINEHEIQINGRLFDIKSEHIFADSVQLELYHDHHEESIIQGVRSFFQCQSEASGIVFHSLWGSWLKWDYLPLETSSFNLDFETTPNSIITRLVFYPASIFLDLLGPPPKAASIV